MDPDTCLANMRAAAARVLAVLDSEGSDPADIIEPAEQLAEAVQSMDGWLSRGGFLPLPWRG